MGKLKTRQAVSKRLRVTKNKKVMKKKNGQDHFNARETGNTTRNKRKNITFGNIKQQKNIATFIPYSF